MLYIYKIINNANLKIYVGMTSKPISKRLNDHFRQAKNPKFRLHRAIRKYEKDNFSIELLQQVLTQEEANVQEKYWINLLNSTDYSVGYNMALGGSGKSIVLSEDIKLKIKGSVQKHRDSLSMSEKRDLTKAANEAKRGVHETEESKIKKSVAQRDRWNTASSEERLNHGKISNKNVSAAGRARSISALNAAFSPARQPGVKKPTATCPHCGKIGGAPVMKRYHFDNCKEKKN